MSQDAWGNYIADFTKDMPTVAAIGGGGIVIGAGSPEGVIVASPGRMYMDELTGELWVKHTGEGNTGWNLVG